MAFRQVHRWLHQTDDGVTPKQRSDSKEGRGPEGTGNHGKPGNDLGRALGREPLQPRAVEDLRASEANGKPSPRESRSSLLRDGRIAMVTASQPLQGRTGMDGKTSNRSANGHVFVVFAGAPLFAKWSVDTNRHVNDVHKWVVQYESYADMAV